MLDSGLACAQSLFYTVLWPFWALEHLGRGHRGRRLQVGFQETRRPWQGRCRWSRVGGTRGQGREESDVRVLASRKVVGMGLGSGRAGEHHSCSSPAPRPHPREIMLSLRCEEVAGVEERGRVALGCSLLQPHHTFR